MRFTLPRRHIPMLDDLRPYDSTRHDAARRDFVNALRAVDEAPNDEAAMRLGMAEVELFKNQRDLVRMASSPEVRAEFKRVRESLE